MELFLPRLTAHHPFLLVTRAVVLNQLWDKLWWSNFLTSKIKHINPKKLNFSSIRNWKYIIK
ncbi:hypothetical protein LPL03_27820 [Lactiplantibacillus argentoratensis]|nr:hypothetical protein LPL03_27820 [Lactiplantibacillus argentoratensis]